MRPARERRLRAQQLPFAREQVEVLLDLLRVLVGVDAEVAEVAALPAERNVQVQPERHAGAGRRRQRRAAHRAPTASGVQTENGG